MISQYYWYLIFNEVDFLATGLTSRSLQLFLEGAGLKDILITRGNYTAITVDGDFLPIGLNSQSPLFFNNRAIFKNSLNDVYYGVKI